MPREAMSEEAAAPHGGVPLLPVQRAEAPALLAARTPITSGTVSLVARSIVGGVPLANRAVAQAVMRETTTFETLDYMMERDKEDAAKGDTLGRQFRAEIVKVLERFTSAPAVEGTAAFDDFLKPETVKAERAATPGWTSCIATLTKVFNDAAKVINDSQGVKAQTTKRGYWVGGMNGLVRFAANFDGEKIATAAGAWVPAPKGGEQHRPRPGDILVLHDKGSSVPSHVSFFYTMAYHGGVEDWFTVDGGQGAKGTWDDVKDDAGNVKKVYHEGSGKQEIKKRDRMYWPATGLIEGEPSQNPDPTKPGVKQLRGWVDVEKLVVEP